MRDAVKRDICNMTTSLTENWITSCTATTSRDFMTSKCATGQASKS